MANITINTDDLITRAIDLEREKAGVLGAIAEHRDNVRRTASMVNDKQFSNFVENFYPRKSRGETRDPKQVQASAKWRRDLLRSHGVETNGDGGE